MSALKALTPYKSGVLLLLIIILLVILISRNTQAVVRAFVAQETTWKTGNYIQTETEHFQIRYLLADSDYVEVIGHTAEDAYVRVSDLFGYQPDHTTTIIIYPDSASLAESFGWEKDQKAMGVYWAGTIRLLSPQEWINGAADWQQTFASEGPVYHEFAHLLVDDITKGNYSRWFTEGIAQHVEKKLTGFEFAEPVIEQNSPYYEISMLEKNFDALDQPIAYWESLQIVEYLVDNYGEQSLLSILNYLGEGNCMEQAVSKTIGIDYKTFESDFLRSLI
ncbi:hypothetical protein ASZ90_019932 [hydrocarbon metagenome]|uniref:OTU domain-containing protein n=1 Tax=hydrocarbon metagenome TaxID=938273 RepID=A0A0W8E223_9ZZZZ